MSDEKQDKTPAEKTQPTEDKQKPVKDKPIPYPLENINYSDQDIKPFVKEDD